MAKEKELCELIGSMPKLTKKSKIVINIKATKKAEASVELRSRILDKVMRELDSVGDCIAEIKVV